MKFLINFFVVTFLFLTNAIIAQNTSKIKVTIDNVSSDKGVVNFALYQKDKFLLEPVQAVKGEIVEGKTTITFNNVAAGEFAIVCFHDKNENGKMDFEPSGMPMEDYGVSNNIMRFGPPQYNDAKFVVADKDVSLSIRF